MKNGGWRELDEGANAALARFFGHSGWEPIDWRMPFHELIEREEDGLDGAPGEYEFRQRIAGVKGFLRFMTERGLHPADMLRQLVAAGRALNVEPFNALKMGEAAQLLGESKAAHSWRCKQLSKMMRRAGLLGTRMPGQKSDGASESYRVARKGNCNRKGGKKLLRAQALAERLRKTKQQRKT